MLLATTPDPGVFLIPGHFVPHVLGITDAHVHLLRYEVLWAQFKQISLLQEKVGTAQTHRKTSQRRWQGDPKASGKPGGRGVRNGLPYYDILCHILVRNCYPNRLQTCFKQFQHASLMVGKLQLPSVKGTHLTPGILQQVGAEATRCTAEVQKSEAHGRHQTVEVVMGFKEFIHDTKTFLEMHLELEKIWKKHGKKRWTQDDSISLEMWLRWDITKIYDLWICWICLMILVSM